MGKVPGRRPIDFLSYVSGSAVTSGDYSESWGVDELLKEEPPSALSASPLLNSSPLTPECIGPVGRPQEEITTRTVSAQAQIPLRVCGIFWTTKVFT